MTEQTKITQRFALADHSIPPSQRKPVNVTVSSTGTDYIWIEAEGYGHPDSGAQIAVEFWGGRLRVMVYSRGDSDPTVIDLEHLRAINLGATVGREQGWDIFERGLGWMQVQRCDESGLLDSDEEAIRLARAAGVLCDDGGTLGGKAVDAI